MSGFWTLLKIDFIEDEFTYNSMRFKKLYTLVTTAIMKLQKLSFTLKKSCPLFEDPSLYLHSFKKQLIEI